MTITGRPGPVVVGTDYSPASARAVSYAAWEARRRHAELRLVHGFVATEPGEVSLAAAAELRLAEATARVGETYPDLSRSSAVIVGSGGMTLVRESDRAGLVVVGARGQGGFAGLQLGSVAAQVAKYAHCPVIVVRSPASAQDRVPGRGCVLVGVDGSESSAPVLAFAFDAAAARAVRLVVVQVWSVPALAAAGYAAVTTHHLLNARQHLQHTADQLLAETLAGWPQKYPQVEVERQARHGDEPARTLLEVAAEVEPDLIVVGSREPGGFEPVLGSVSQAVTLHARASVAVVRPDPL
jgi:nucleotide-binding universal stress UspA family protein